MNTLSDDGDDIDFIVFFSFFRFFWMKNGGRPRLPSFPEEKRSRPVNPQGSRFFGVPFGDSDSF